MRKTSKKTQKTESANPEIAAEAPSPTKKGSHGDKKILSIAIDPSLHSKLALCARCEGRSVTDLVVEAVSKNLKARIAAALETLKADLDK
jgi:predicted HicB family RNase H-like nuclease